MTRAIVLTCSVLLCTGFAWPPDYAEQSQADVSTCVSYARRTSPAFEAWVRGVDLETGRVDIERSPRDDSRGDTAGRTRRGHQRIRREPRRMGRG